MSAIISNTHNKNLHFVENLDDYKVHHDDVDPTGFAVKLTSGEKVGEVEGLLADVESKMVRYLEIEVDEDIINHHTRGLYQNDQTRALIPVGIIAINADDKVVVINDVLYDHIVDYPRFSSDSGYTTRYEIDTNDFLSDFHPFSTSYDRERFSNDRYRNADYFDNAFYQTQFYTGR